MIHVPGDCIVYFDVDDTLIYWSPTSEQLERSGVTYVDPDTGIATRFAVNKKNLDQIYYHYYRNHPIVVWSAGGSEWAKRAVEMLKIEQYVSLVICKPKWIVDDQNPADFMPKPYYIKEEK